MSDARKKNHEPEALRDEQLEGVAGGYIDLLAPTPSRSDLLRESMKTCKPKEEEKSGGSGGDYIGTTS